MRKALPYLGAALSVLVMSWSAQAQAQDKKFQDVPESHWAYQAVTELQQKNILLGYPDGYFRGKRTLTRYEFAVALQRALANLPAGTKGEKGDPGPPGPQGDQGPVGPPGMTPEEVTALRNLTQEFQNELRQLGTDVRSISNRLDALANDVANLRAIVSRLPQISGNAFFGFRTDRSRFAYFDYGGVLRPAQQAVLNNVDAVHDFQLNLRQNLKGGGTIDVTGIASNYLGYRAAPVGGEALLLGGPSAANKNGNPEQVGLYEARLDLPIRAVGDDTRITLGRFRHQVTPLTYYRPDTDPYFDVPGYDDGNWVTDGFAFSSKFGSATTSLFAGSFSNLGTTTAGAFLNKPIVGATNGPRFLNLAKPVGYDFVNNQGAVVANQVAGFHLGIPVGRVVEIGGTIIDLSTSSGAPTPNNITGPGPGYGNVVVYGANVKALNLGRFSANAEAAKTVTQSTFDTGDGRDNEDNNAYILNVGYNSGPINAQAGYQYYDPRFNAPGYWNKIGNWYNPTNVKGPFARVTYRFSDVLQGHLGADYLEGARNRATTIGGLGSGFGIGDNLTRATAGIKFILGRKVTLGGDYEGVFYNISAAASASNANSKPVEQYITASAGLNLSSNTVLKLAYQIINVQNVGGAFGGGIGGDGSTANASVFTTQVAVHF